LKLLFDNNLSIKLPEIVEDYFPHSAHVVNLHLEKLSDKEIFKFAGDHQFTIVTKDKDFYHLLNTFGSPPKVIWISIGNCSNQMILEVLINHKKEIAEFIKSSRSLLVIGQ
jgi:predicted nuclease of predicted toxin-antitoxin system